MPSNTLTETKHLENYIFNQHSKCQLNPKTLQQEAEDTDCCAKISQTLEFMITPLQKNFQTKQKRSSHVPISYWSLKSAFTRQILANNNSPPIPNSSKLINQTRPGNLKNPNPRCPSLQPNQPINIFVWSNNCERIYNSIPQQFNPLDVGLELHLEKWERSWGQSSLVLPRGIPRPRQSFQCRELSHV